MRTRPILIPALLTAAALQCAACGGGSSADAAPAAPALSKAEAAQVVQRYARLRNQANSRPGKAADGRLLAGAETAPQLEMDVAVYKLRRAAKQAAKPFAYTRPVFYIPRLGGYPRWFAVDTIAQDASPAKDRHPVRHALLFVQNAERAPWLLAADPFPTGSPLSSVRLDREGYAEAVPSGDDGLAIAPGQLAASHAALLGGSGKTPSGGKVIGAGPHSSQARDALGEVTEKLKSAGIGLTTQFVPNGTPAYALRTKDGGALVWYVVRQTESYSADKPGKLAVSGDLVGLAPPKAAKTRLDTTVLIQYLATVPKKGPVNITGIYRKAIAAKAS